MSPVRSFCLLIVFSFVFGAYAQTVKKPVKTNPVVAVTKFKPPVVQTFLGRNEKEATVTVEEAN